jgi:predicted N-acetyltransferase YhbS
MPEPARAPAEPISAPVDRIRPAGESDVRAVAELWCEAFPARRTIADRIRMLETGGRYGGLETVLVAVDAAGQLAGACKIYRLEERIAGAAMPMMGLAAVAVPENRRRQGIGARLCHEAIDAAVERGDLLSVLYPFRPSFYERLGWGLVGELHEYRFRTDGLPTYPEAAAVRPAREEDQGPIAACYRRIVERANGPITRDHTIWGYRLTGEELGVRPIDDHAPPTGGDDPTRQAIVYDDGSGVGAYALLRYLPARAGRDGRIQIRELLAETETAYRGLLGHLATLADRWPLARHFARPGERFGDRLSDPRPPGHRPVRSLYFPTARVVQGPMLRVLDVPGALRQRPWYHASGGEGAAATFSIAVQDAQRPGNAGPWLVRVGQDGSEVEAQSGGGGATPDAGLEADAATFARIFAGEVRASDAARLGHAIVHGRVPLLDAAFATRERFWLLDEF